MSKPVWLTIAERLIIQVQRDLKKQRSAAAREARAKALYTLEARARLSLPPAQQKARSASRSSLQGASS